MIDAGVASLPGPGRRVELVSMNGLWAVASGTGPGADWSAHAAREALLERSHELLAAGRKGDAPAASSLLREVFVRAAERAHRATVEEGEAREGHLAVVLRLPGRALLAHAGEGRAVLSSDRAVRQLTPDPRLDSPEAVLQRIRRQPLGRLPTCVPDLVTLNFEDANALVIASPGVLGGAPLVLDHMQSSEDSARALLTRALRRGEQGELAALVLRDKAAPAVLESSLERGLEISPLFSHLDAETRHRLAPYLLEHDLDQGQQLFAEGDAGQRLYIVLRGELSVRRGGRELVRLGPGRHLGEIALVLDGRRTATVVAATQARVASLHRRHLQELLDTRPELGIGIVEGLCRELAGRVTKLSEPASEG